jgi:ABC-type antimicrobial peptide transport system permease subunit
MKASMIITVFGIIIFLISSFFTFFAFDKLVNNELICVLHQVGGCAEKTANTLTFGIAIVITLLIMIISAAYVMVKNISIEAKHRRKKKG